MKILIEGKGGPEAYDSHSGEPAYVDSDGESIPYAIHPLTPQLGSTAFEALLLKPEQLETKNLTVFFFGIGADYQQYGGLAQEIAKLGMPVALHKTPPTERFARPAARDILSSQSRTQLLKSALYLYKLELNPYVHDSQTAEVVANAAMEHSPELEGVTDYAHSKGGLGMIIHANFDERVQAGYADSISGMVNRPALLNHAESAVPILRDVRSIMGTLPAENRPEMIDQFKQNKLLIALQLLHLIGPRPSIEKGLKRLQESSRDVPIVYVSRAKDSIFKDRDTQLAARSLLKLGLIAHHERVEDSTHHAPIEKPAEAALLFRDLLQQQADKRAA